MIQKPHHHRQPAVAEISEEPKVKPDVEADLDEASMAEEFRRAAKERAAARLASLEKEEPKAMAPKDPEKTEAPLQAAAPTKKAAKKEDVDGVSATMIRRSKSEADAEDVVTKAAREKASAAERLKSATSERAAAEAALSELVEENTKADFEGKVQAAQKDSDRVEAEARAVKEKHQSKINEAVQAENLNKQAVRTAARVLEQAFKEKHQSKINE